MKLQGKLVFWSIDSKTEVDREQLRDKLLALGDCEEKTKKKRRGVTPAAKIVDLLPRGDNKNALIRALRTVLKKDETDERFYRRHNDRAGAVDFTVTLTREVQENGETDYEYEKELTISLDKEAGTIKFKQETPLNATILDQYRRMKRVTDAPQLSALLRRLVDEEMLGVPLKNGSGVYYVTDAMADRLNKMEQVVDMLPAGCCRYHAIPAYNDKPTTAALQDAASDDVMRRILDLRAEIEEGTARLKKSGDGALKTAEDKLKDFFGSRRSEMEEIRRRALVFRGELGDKLSQVNETIEAYEEALENASKRPEKFDLISALNKIANG